MRVTIKDSFEKVISEFDGNFNGSKYYPRTIKMTFEDGSTVVGYPVGDCCAETYITDVCGEGFLSHGTWTFKSSEKKDLGSFPVSYGYVDVFAEILTFTDGRYENNVMILCSCEHNGYYGGWIEWRNGVSLLETT